MKSPRSPQAACLGLLGILVAAGCGGAETKAKSDAGGGANRDTEGMPSPAALNVTPNSVNLGTLDVGASGSTTVTVTNTGESPSGTVLVTASEGISATGCGIVLEPNKSCSIGIVASPTKIGAFNGTVNITATPGAQTALVVAVVAKVEPAGMFSVSPTKLEIGNILVGAAAPKQTIRVTAAVAITDLTISSNGPDVAIDKTATTCAPALAAGATCQVVVDFTATGAGPRNGGVVISGGGASGKVVTVPISANGQNPAKLVINPSLAQTLAVAIGETSSPVSFSVMNTGDVPTGTLNVAISGAKSALFKATSNCLVLASLKTCTISVTYAPTVVSTGDAATLTVTDGVTGGSSVSVPLNGVATGGSTLQITSAATDLGTVLVNTTGPSTVFTVTNNGDTESQPVDISLSSGEFVVTNDTCSGAVLAAKTGTCTISIALKPATVGGKTAVLTVTGGSNSAVKTITGTGIRNASLSVSPSSLDFGSVRVNKLGTAQTVTVKNDGGNATGPLNFSRTGNFAAFPISSNGCSAALQPGTSCTFAVNFAPTAAQGETAIYTVTDGTTSGAVSVSGTGLAASGISIDPTPVAACPDVVVNPPRANTSGICFPTTVLGGTSSTVVFTITADDPLPAGLTDTGALSVALAGTNVDDFTIVNNGCTTALLAGAACQVSVTFTPKAAGSRQASLTVTTTNGGAAAATLQSTGLAVLELKPLGASTDGKITGLDFGQVPLLGDTNSELRFEVIARGPNSETNFISQVLTTLLDPTQPADFSYAPLLTNPCNTASNEAVRLNFHDGSATGATPQSWTWNATKKQFACDFTVRFYPQSSKGNKTATLTATGSDNSTDSKSLTGVATGALTFDPANPTFGTDWQVGDSSNTEGTVTIVTMLSDNDVTVTLENHSTTTDIGPISLTLGGADADQFAIVRDLCSTTRLSHNGGQCLVSLAFLPSSAGQKTAILTANGGTETTSVTITGGAEDTANITITPNQCDGFYPYCANNPYDFGTVPQGGTSAWTAFTITNPTTAHRSAQVVYDIRGGDPYVIADGTNGHDFGSCGISGSTALQPGRSCTFFVQFHPTLAMSPGSVHEGWIAAYDAASRDQVFVQFTGRVSSVLSIAPEAYTFPDTAEGLTSAATTLTVTNRGTSTITLGIPTNDSIAPFNLDQTTGCATGARTLAAGATCPLVVNFVGEVSHDGVTRERDLVIAAAGSSHGEATTTLTGTTVKPAKLELVGFDNAAADFSQHINLGGVRIGYQSGDVTLTFKNTGSAATSALRYQWSGVATANTQDGEFLIGNEVTTCAGRTSLAADATCTITVRFAPSSTSAAGTRGPKNFSLGADTGGIVRLLTFDAYALNPSSSAWIGISGGALAFFTFPGSVASTGSTFPSQVFQLTNGTATSVSITLSISDATNFTLVRQGDEAGSAPCGATLNASSSCTFGVTFHPTAWSATSAFRQALVSVGPFDGAQLGVYGQVRSPAVLSLTPKKADAFDFGEVVLGSIPTKSFTVTNTGETTSGTITIHSTATSQYSFSGCTSTLAPGVSCVGTVGFNAGTTAGTFGGTFYAADDAAQSNTATLTATAAFDTLLAVTPAQMTFSAQPVGTRSDLQYVQLGNAADTRTSGLLTISLADQTNFSVVNYSCPEASDPNADTGLAGGTSCLVALMFKPQSLGTGTFNTTLSFTASPGGTRTVTVTGTAVSALTTVPATSYVVGSTYTLPTATASYNPFIITVQLAEHAPATAYIRTSMSGGNYMIVEDQCVATQMLGGGSCLIKVVYLGGTDTPLKSGTLTINGGTPGNTATLILNSTTPPPVQ